MNFLIRYVFEVGFFGEVLPNQPVGVFIGASFPAVIGPCKEEINPEHLADRLMPGKFFPIVSGDGIEKLFYWIQGIDGGVSKSVSCCMLNYCLLTTSLPLFKHTSPQPPNFFPLPLLFLQ